MASANHCGATVGISIVLIISLSTTLLYYMYDTVIEFYVVICSVDLITPSIIKSKGTRHQQRSSAAVSTGKNMGDSLKLEDLGRRAGGAGCLNFHCSKIRYFLAYYFEDSR